jgi:glucosylceramidase
VRRFALAILLFLLGLSVLACQTTTTTSFTTTDPTTATTTTTVPTTTTTTTTTSETTTLWPETDYASISVDAFSTNNAQRFADIGHLVSAWDATWNDPSKITIDARETYQTFYGTGAALTLSSARVILDSPDKDAIIAYLFGPNGLAINLVRLTVGASDFVPPNVPHYTYNDTVNNVADPTLSGFSIEQDREIIDILKVALEINPNITFIAAPWSAPAWMKDNKSLYMGSLKSENQSVYGNYLVKYLQVMKEEGIEIDYLSIQNEPRYASNNYPGMMWDRYLTTSFVGEHLGPKIAAAELSTKIMIWDHNVVDNNGFYEQLPFQVLRNATAASYVGAIGVHCYSGTEAQMQEYVQMLYDNNQTVEVFMTECTATTQYKNVESNMLWSVRRMYTEAYNRFAVGTTYWNMALDPQGTMHNGGCGTCTGLISVPITGASGFTVEADGYITGHFNRTILPGAKRIFSFASNSSLIATAFLDSTGRISIVVFNNGVARNTTILWQDSRFRVPLPANSLTTISFQIPQGEPA